MLLQACLLDKNISLWDREDQDQTANSVQSDLNLLCLQMVSSLIVSTC